MYLSISTYFQGSLGYKLILEIYGLFNSSLGYCCSLAPLARGRKLTRTWIGIPHVAYDFADVGLCGTMSHILNVSGVSPLTYILHSQLRSILG